MLRASQERAHERHRRSAVDGVDDACSVAAGAAEFGDAGRSPTPNHEGGSMPIPQRALLPSAVFMQLVTGESSSYRLCRALANAGVLEEHDGKRFSLTPVGECLRTDIPGSMAGTAKMFGERWHSVAWAELLHSVRTGEPAFPKAYGEGLFEWFRTHRKEAEIFNDAMTSFSSTTAAAVVDAYDFSSFTRLADIGGGHGFLLASILEANPRLRGVLFDLPSSASEALVRIDQVLLAGRLLAVDRDLPQP
jgi:O-methyltransferase domain